jgi:hypothetical protein
MATFTGLTMVFIIHGYIGHFITHPAITVALIGITTREEAVVEADKREEGRGQIYQWAVQVPV